MSPAQFIDHVTSFALQLQEEKIAAIEEKLELSTQKLAQMSSLPEMEEQLKARMEALNQVGIYRGMK